MKAELTNKQKEELLQILRERFEKNTQRHMGLSWANVGKKLEKNPDKVKSLFEMEATGGEPDVIVFASTKSEIIFCDCSAESPSGRRSLCYDQTALNTRKENKPKNSALSLAEEMGVEIMNEQHYRTLQKHGKFDSKTSSWIHTPPAIRELGGALFADNRYGTVFVYHNGAESYYAARGFRAVLKIS